MHRVLRGKPWGNGLGHVFGKGLAGWSLGLALSLSAATALAAAPVPVFPAIAKAAQLNDWCTQGLQATRQRLQQLERCPVDARWLAAYDDFYAFQEDWQAPVDFLLNVHPDAAVRDAAQRCAQSWADFNAALGQNETVYRALRRAPTPQAVDREMQRQALAAFEDSGVALPVAKRKRARAILTRLADLDQRFNQAIRDARVRVAFQADELAGVPAAVWQDAPRDEQGRVVLGVDYPSYVPVMQSAELEVTRQRMWLAKVNEGSEGNMALLDEITRLRREYAQLFGHASYSDFSLRRRMAADTRSVQRFLDEVKQAVRAREQQDLRDLHEAKAQHLGRPAEQVQVERWDLSFYGERLRKARYQVDQEAFRRHFPPQETLQWALRVIERMMGVRYQRDTAAEVGLWHAEVQAYRVEDAASGAALGHMLVDLYPREGKYNHAAVWPLRSSALRSQRLPSAALVVNFDRKGLTLDEVETLLHELGHAVHVDLSRTQYALQGGTSVMHDFVEAPSQMLEDWVYDPQVLALMAEVCPACEPVPAEKVAQARAAQSAGKGLHYGTQHLYASYDLALHGGEPVNPAALWSSMEGASVVGHVPGTRFPAGFTHIAGGYGAGYYGYLWSLVLAMDMRTAFAADKLDATIGRAYRDKVLAQGSQKPAPQLVRDFLGRDFNARAFFDDLAR